MESRRKNNKIIVILGPTSSGKSSIAIKLAKKFNGEVISADSRQIYRGMNIGTGKITKKEQALAKHYMLDVISPKTNFNVNQFKKKTEKIITNIFKRKKIPIICGGTGFWIKALVDNVIYPEVKPNWKLREKLGGKSAEKLFILLKKLDPVRAKNIDAKNPVRLIRALEICSVLGKVPSLSSKHSKYQFIQIGINLSKEKLHQNIEKRLKQRFSEGMIAEVERLHREQKISWKKMESFGLSYLWIAKFLQKQLPQKELFEKVYQAEKDYAKRQMTWFKKDPRIIWKTDYSAIKNEVSRFFQA
jgi:tRNA dimethylallyltransferase